MIFSYMYQPNLPQIYHELTPKNESSMRKVIVAGTFVAAMCYFLSGFFGYATFAMNPNAPTIMSTQNIFDAPYFNERFLVMSMFLLIGGVVLSTPLSVLPCKDTIEELALGQSRLMTETENVVVTVLVTVFCFLFAILVPNIGDCLLVVGATSCPVIGFVLPVAYWLKTDKSPKYSFQRILAVSVAVLASLFSLMSLWFFFDAEFFEGPTPPPQVPAQPAP